MRALEVLGKPRGRLHILCLGAHSDDIEIGCGGLILQLLRESRSVDVDWMVFSAHGRREQEARRSAALFLRGARRQRVMLRAFRTETSPRTMSKRSFIVTMTPFRIRILLMKLQIADRRMQIGTSDCGLVQSPTRESNLQSAI